MTLSFSISEMARFLVVKKILQGKYRERKKPGMKSYYSWFRFQEDYEKEKDIDRQSGRQTDIVDTQIKHPI